MGFDECGFVLIVPRMESLKDGPYPNPFEIAVSIETHPLATGCMNLLRQGDRVRILGSLAIRSSQIAIVPEHIEYKLKEIPA